MLRNYLSTAIRSIRRNKVHSFIKIFGLSLGIAACILIYLFVIDEFSYDKFHKNGDRLFRVVQVRYDKVTGQETGLQQYIPPAVGPEIERFLEGIEHQSRITVGTGVVQAGTRIFRENLTLVDSAFFEMFSFSLIKGDKRTVLSDEHSVVFTRSMAQKYFGEDTPLGSTISIACGNNQKDYILTGIVEDVPENSSIQFDCVIHFNNLPAVLNNADILANWDRWYCPLFIQLRKNVLTAGAEEGLDQFCDLYYSAKREQYIESGHDPFTFGLQPVKAMRLDSRVVGAPGLSASFLLSAIAFVILLIACFNFMNLSIGLSSVRSLEVGMRKVLGARRAQLIRQFVSEGLIISFLAVLLGLVMAEFLLGRFNGLAGKTLSLSTMFSGFHILGLAAIGLLAGLSAGSWPALVLSAFQPGDIMKGRLKIGGKTRLTKVLVVLQFSLSVFLALSAVILTGQVSYMVNSDPGYRSEGLVVVMTQENQQEPSQRILQLFRNEAQEQSRILGVTASNRAFGLFLPGSSLETGERSFHYRFNRVDPYFLSTLKIPLIEGRDFTADSGADRGAVIVNQSFMDKLGPDYRVGDIMGDPASGFPHDRRIIGVVEDCHFESLRNEIEPMLIYVGKGPAARRDVFSRIFVRIESGQIQGTLDFLKTAWRKIQPDKPFVHYFQDSALINLYAGDRRWSAIIRYASGFSILLACLGVFGLTTLSLARREKEIGIRKVLGARLEQILYLSMREFLVLISISNLIAWPVAYIVMRGVLQSYAYRIPIGLHYFILAGAASILLTVSTILYLSVKAAFKNPVESLRYE